MIRLKQLREELGISQTTFSKQLGFGQSTVSNWENGNRILDVNTATMLAKFFDVSVDYLLGNSDIREKTLSEEGIKKGTIQITGRDGSFVERELTDDQIDIVKRMVDQMPVFRRSTNHLKSPPENQTPLYPLFPDPSSPINYWDDRHTSTQMLADDPFPLTPPKQNRKTPPEDDET